MKTIALLAFLPMLLSAAEKPLLPPQSSDPPPNPNVDYRGFTQAALDLEKVRTQNLVSEEDFIRMMGEPKTIVLDARSKAKFDMMHVKGALHLDLTDFNAPALEKLIPDKATRVLIYCNNNFKNAEPSFPAKVATVALNVQTFINLHTYGYKNVKELAPLIEIEKVKLPMEGSAIAK